jgi:ATP-dependent DNA ligase
MNLPVSPPVRPMLGKLARELPAGDYLYEPKWDGFRCLAFRSGARVDLRSRHDRPLGRYFPELVEQFLIVDCERFVVDGEIVVTAASGSDFPALMARLHPAASRVRRLSVDAPARLNAFDLLALEGDDLRERAFVDRRRRLESLLDPCPPRLGLSELSDDPAVAARWLDERVGRGVDGVVAKRRDLRYVEGGRTMVKVKRERTLDCVVAGFRWAEAEPLVAALLLGLYDDAGALAHIGVASQFKRSRRIELVAELEALIVELDAHPWSQGFLVEGGPTGRLPGAAGSWRPGEMELDWVPVAPLRVCEVAYDHIEHGRLRHPARFVRWREDREPRSCTFDQLEPARPPRG